MINFKMTTKENFASFIDRESGVVVFVDSFDNFEFDVRVGNFLESQSVGVITADNDEMLNSKLTHLYNKKRQEQRCQ